MPVRHSSPVKVGLMIVYVYLSLKDFSQIVQVIACTGKHYYVVFLSVQGDHLPRYFRTRSPDLFISAGKQPVLRVLVCIFISNKVLRFQNVRAITIFFLIIPLPFKKGLLFKDEISFQMEQILFF